MGTAVSKGNFDYQPFQSGSFQSARTAKDKYSEVPAGPEATRDGWGLPSFLKHTVRPPVVSARQEMKTCWRD